MSGHGSRALDEGERKRSASEARRWRVAAFFPPLRIRPLAERGYADKQFTQYCLRYRIIKGILAITKIHVNIKTMISLSVVIIAKNEESRLARCLQSIHGWAKEIIVIDDESMDKTCEIAQSFGARIFKRKMDIEGKHRNWGYAQATCDWVFSLDADEVLTQELKRDISETLAQPTAFVAFTVPRKNYLGDYWVKGAGQYPARQIKLFRKDKFKWAHDEVHPRAMVDGQCGHLKGDLLHYTYRGWGDFITKLNNQTTWEAKKWYRISQEDPNRAWRKLWWGHIVWRMVDRFFRVFIAKKGYRDGFIGFMFASFAGLYWFFTYAKYRELKSGADKVS